VSCALFSAGYLVIAMSLEYATLIMQTTGNIVAYPLILLILFFIAVLLLVEVLGPSTL
jgi:hypothetical protein